MTGFSPLNRFRASAVGLDLIHHSFSFLILFALSLPFSFAAFKSCFIQTRPNATLTSKKKKKLRALLLEPQRGNTKEAIRIFFLGGSTKRNFERVQMSVGATRGRQKKMETFDFTVCKDNENTQLFFTFISTTTMLCF